MKILFVDHYVNCGNLSCTKAQEHLDKVKNDMAERFSDLETSDFLVKPAYFIVREEQSRVEYNLIERS